MGKTVMRSGPAPDSKKFKTPAERRKALLRIQQGGAQKVGKVYDDVEKRIKIAEGVAKTAIAIDTAAAVINPVSAARKVVVKAGQEAAKRHAARVAGQITTTATGKGGTRAGAEAAKKTAQAKENLGSKYGPARQPRRDAANKLKANQAEAAKKTTPPRQSGPDPRGSSASHTSHKAARRDNPQQTVTKHRKTTQEYPRLPKDTTKPLQGPMLPPSSSSKLKPKFGKEKVAVKRDPASVKKRGADMTKAEKDARKTADQASRKKSHGLTGREKLKAADASKQAQKEGLASKKNFLTQGSKGQKRREKLGAKRADKAERKQRR